MFIFRREAGRVKQSRPAVLFLFVTCSFVPLEVWRCAAVFPCIDVCERVFEHPHLAVEGPTRFLFHDELIFPSRGGVAVRGTAILLCVGAPFFSFPFALAPQHRAVWPKPPRPTPFLNPFQTLRTHADTQSHTQSHTHTLTHAHTRARAHTHTHACTQYTHTHTHTHTHTPPHRSAR